MDYYRDMGDGIDVVNERVEVVAAYYQHDQRSLCYPIKMKHKNTEIVFTELALRHPTAKGRRMIHVFDMTDGQIDYRLEFDAEALTWTLVATLDGRQLPALTDGQGGDNHATS